MPVPINVRGVDHDLWRELRAESVRRDMTVGVLLNEIIREWLTRHGATRVAPAD